MRKSFPQLYKMIQCMTFHYESGKNLHKMANKSLVPDVWLKFTSMCSYYKQGDQTGMGFHNLNVCRRRR